MWWLCCQWHQTRAGAEGERTSSEFRKVSINCRLTNVCHLSWLLLFVISIGFDCGMVVVVGVRQVCQKLMMGFSCTTICKAYREWPKTEKMPNERQLCGQKCLVDVRGQGRMGRLVPDDRNATVTQIATCYGGMQNCISEHSIRPTLKKIGHITPLLPAKDSKVRLQVKECFQQLAEGISWRILAVLKAKWVLTFY